jgi:hypothetical protein
MPNPWKVEISVRDSGFMTDFSRASSTPTTDEREDGRYQREYNQEIWWAARIWFPEACSENYVGSEKWYNRARDLIQTIDPWYIP